MKKSAAILYASVLAAALTTACNPEKEAAKSVAYEYSAAMANYDIDKAETYVTPETKETLRRARNIVRGVGEEYIRQDTPATIEITDITIKDDTIAVASYHKHTPIKDFDGTLDLRKRNGNWLAHCPLEYLEVPKQ